MKHLTLVRHAQAEPESQGFKDFDRPLTPGGTEEARRAAQQLAAGYPPPDLIVASPARRALETARLFAETCGYPLQQLTTDKQIYLAGPADLLTVIHAVPDDIGRLTIVGHNPGISNLVRLLAPDISFSEFATATACAMTFEAPSWTAVDKAAPTNVRFHLP